MVIALGIIAGVLFFLWWSKSTELEERKNENRVLKNNLKETEENFRKFQEDSRELIKTSKEIKSFYLKQVDELDELVEEKCGAYPQTAVMVADLQTVVYERSAVYLDRKKRPAHTEAMRIRELKQETKKIIQQNKELEYKLAYIQEIFPNITDVFDSGFVEEQNFQLETEENTDRVRFFLTPEEYRMLSVAQKNQLALDRYVASRKSRWQVGRDYEMYIGYLYESRGYRVLYTGIIKKLEDMGRDLIVSNGEKTFIIQCKHWAKEKTIHEKHIFQLFGTVVLYNIDHKDNPAKGVFVSTTKLSSKAMDVAEQLDIQVVYQEVGCFPRIKCNINRQTGEKIYHLPFDQQYDSVVVDASKSEFYAFTVKEAESQGFRRAMRHIAGTNSENIV